MIKVAGIKNKAEQAVGSVALVLAVTSLISGYFKQQHDHQVIDCQTKINTQFLDTLKERARLSAEDTANINKLVQEVFTVNDKKTALADYQSYLTEVDRINGEVSRASYPSFNRC